MATLQERIDAALLLVGSDIGDLANSINQTASESSLQSLITAMGDKATAPLQQAVLDQLTNGNTNVNALNVTTKFREAFETFDTTNVWNSQINSGDIVRLDGNTMGSSYLTISLSPFNTSGETYIETKAEFSFPVELSVGLHMSQRTSGQEVSIELIDSVDSLSDINDIQISSISQTTTTLTVNTVTPHNLVVGKTIGIKGVSDNRANYAQVTVASTPSPTQFTVTGGCMGTIQSMTLATINNSGYVYFRPRVSRAYNGASIIFENNTATNASMYIRGAGGDAYPSGTVSTNHSVSVGTTASVQPVNNSFNYSFQPSNEYRILAQADRLQFADIVVDNTGLLNNRFTRTQVVPEPNKTYKLRIKGKNLPSTTVPIAKIVSISKSGTTTATVVTNVPHNLSTTSWVNIYGVRDQTNFANLTSITQVASIVNATTFTVVLGTAVTATSYGGCVYLANGGRAASEIGAQTPVLQSISCTGGIVTAIANTNWAVLIGDYINLYGIRDTAGAVIQSDIFDGAYRVQSINTTTAILEPIDNRTLPTQTTINCGGAAIRRTDIRLSFVRVFDYDRLRVESTQRAYGDAAMSLPVYVQSSVSLASGTSNIGYAGLYPPILVNDVASAAITTTTTVSAITPSFGNSYEVNIPVTAVSGTTPTMDINIEESDDNGTNWYPVYSFPRITATGIYRSPRINLTGTRVRYVQTITGTSPSFTRAINRLHYTDTGTYLRQYIDRTIAPNTISSTTPALNVQNCTNMQMVVNMGAATTAPVLTLQGSDDNGTTWYDLPNSNLTTVANATVQLSLANFNCQLARVRVSTAGSSATLGWVLLKAFTIG